MKNVKSNKGLTFFVSFFYYHFITAYILCIYETLNYARILKIFPKIFVFLWIFVYICTTIRAKVIGI